MTRTSTPSTLTPPRSQAVALVINTRHDAGNDVPLALGVSGGSGRQVEDRREGVRATRRGDLCVAGVGLLWDCCGTVVGLERDWCGTVVGLLWD